MRRIAYFDCFSGASGDMILGALLHAGADADALRQMLSRLDIGAWSLEMEDVARHGIGALRAIVRTPEESGHGRHLHHIETIIRSAGLPREVEEPAIAIFRRLGEAEAAIHQTDVESLHFHEVGAVDAIVDIVGACVLLHLLGIERVFASPLPMGHGFVECMHGTIPLPAPAVVELTKGVPTYGVDAEAELVTPTGAAILTTLAESFGPMPALRTKAVGYGAGSRELPDRPNLLRVVIGEEPREASVDTVAVVETNIDDLSPQFYEAAMERLFQAGALDVFLQPVVMKKSRPGVLVTALCPPALVEKVAAVLFAETTTLGVRIYEARRQCMERRLVPVETPYGAIRMKVARWGDMVDRAMPEYEDVRRAADAARAPVTRVWEAAMLAYREQKGT